MGSEDETRDAELAGRAERHALTAESRREDETRTVVACGVAVIITRSAGSDKAPVVFVDTSETLDTENGPAIRIRLNDEPVYTGVAYELEDEPNV